MTTPFGSPHSESELSEPESPELSLAEFSESDEALVSPRRAHISPAEREYSGFKSDETGPTNVCISPCASCIFVNHSGRSVFSSGEKPKTKLRASPCHHK